MFGLSIFNRRTTQGQISGTHYSITRQFGKKAKEQGKYKLEVHTRQGYVFHTAYYAQKSPAGVMGKALTSLTTLVQTVEGRGLWVGTYPVESLVRHTLPALIPDSGQYTSRYLVYIPDKSSVPVLWEKLGVMGQNDMVIQDMGDKEASDVYVYAKALSGHVPGKYMYVEVYDYCVIKLMTL